MHKHDTGAKNFIYLYTCTIITLLQRRPACASDVPKLGMRDAGGDALSSELTTVITVLRDPRNPGPPWAS